VALFRKTKRFLLGEPLHNATFSHQRLSNPVALAVFSSDALSSVAYATQEILLVLVAAGAAALHFALPVAISIAALLVIVVTSYRQTIKAYPHGGGSYSVAKENLGDIPGLTAGSSLLVDYVLTVAVSVSAGVAAMTSAFPALYPYRVEVAVAFVILLTIANLRGVKESGALFAGPTFAFVALLGATILYGIYKHLTGGVVRVPAPEETVAITSAVTLFLLARAFSSGCTAMTGVEAIANGVAVFKDPTAKNARKTLTVMAGILVALFVGISWLAVTAGAYASETETVISQLARSLYGTSVPYYLLQFATMMILVLAANTAYADFPRLASFMASDDFLPHQFTDKGHRLVFSKGIIFLAIVAAVLIAAFGANVSGLIPLYAVGVFCSFSLSQSGMVVHWWKSRGKGWVPSIAVNAIGAIVCFFVFALILVTKFTHGAWAVAVVIPLLIFLFLGIRRHYRMATAAAVPGGDDIASVANAGADPHNHVIILAKCLDRRLLGAIRYAKLIKADTKRVLHLNTGDCADEFRDQYLAAGFGIDLEIVESPFREVISVVVDYVRDFKRNPEDTLTVIVSEFSPDDAVDLALHSQVSTILKALLFAEPNVVVVSVPFHFED
jgi:amino acid transporter